MKKGIYVIMVCAGLLVGCGSSPQIEAEGGKTSPLPCCQCCNPEGEECMCCLCN